MTNSLLLTEANVKFFFIKVVGGRRRSSAVVKDFLFLDPGWGRQDFYKTLKPRCLKTAGLKAGQSVPLEDDGG